MELMIKTDEVVEAGEKINKISKEVDELILNLYQVIDGLRADGAWQGISANRYFEKLSKDSVDMRNVSFALKNYGEVLVSCGNLMDKTAKKYMKL